MATSHFPNFTGAGPAEHSPLLPWRTHWTIYTQDCVWASGRPETDTRAGRPPPGGGGLQGQGMWEGSSGTYLKADGPIPIGVKGVEEEVCVSGGIWGEQR